MPYDDKGTIIDTSCLVTLHISNAQYQSNDFTAFLSEQAYAYFCSVLTLGGQVKIMIKYIDAEPETYWLRDISAVKEFFHKN